MRDLGRLTTLALATIAPLSGRLTDEARVRHVGALRPTSEELLRVLEDGRAEEARRAYAALWRLRPVFGPARAGAGFSLDAASGADFRAANRRAWRFPSGYRDIAAAIRPEAIWFTWTYADGASFDGLVFTGERLVWLPQPFRFLSPTPIPAPAQTFAHWAL